MTNIFLKLFDWIISAVIGILVVKSVPYIQKYVTKNYSSYRDKLYKEAALKYTHKTALMTHTLLTNFFSFVLLLVSFFLLSIVGSTKKEFLNLFENTSGVSKESLASEITKIKSQFVYVDIASYFVLVTVIILVVMLIWNDKRNIAINNIIMTFENKLVLLAPEISEKKVLLLRRQWAKMSSFDDYISISSEINQLYTQYGL